LSPSSARANAALGQGGSPADYLSPRQRWLYQQAAARPGAGWPSEPGAAELKEAFARAEELAGATP
jgi:hypothetical protein